MDRIGYVKPVISLRTLVSNVLTLGIGSGLSQVLMAASFLLMSRQLGAARLGAFSSCFSAVALVSILFNWGLDSWLLRSGAHQSERLDELLGGAIAIKVGSGFLWLIGVLVIVPKLNPEIFTVRLVAISAVAVWLEGIFSLVLGAFKALLRNRTTAALLTASRGTILLLTLLLIVADVRTPTVYAWVRLLVGVILVTLSVMCLPFRIRLGTRAELVSIWREARSFALSDLFTSVYVQADITIAAVFLTSEAVGLYSPASSLVNALFIVPSALFSVVVPTLVRLLRDHPDRFNRALPKTVLGFAAVGIALWVGTYLMSGFLPKFALGGSFSQSGPLLRILSPIIFLKSCSFAFAAILVTVGWQRYRVNVQALSATVNVVLNLVLIRQLGISGVAGTYVTSEVLLAVGYLMYVLRWLRSSRFIEVPSR